MSGLSVIDNGLERQQKMERLALLGQMSAGVVHDVRNMLCSLGLSLECAEAHMGETSPKTERNLERAHRMLGQLDHLLESVLSFSRHNTRIEMVDLIALVRDTVAFLKPTARKHSTEIEVLLESGSAHVLANSGEISQVLCNLVLNACQAGATQVTLTIGSGPSGATIEIEDNGCGIAADKLAKVFEAFHTSKASGSGLGLWNSRRVMENYGGTLELTSEVDQGSCFTLSFPVPQAPTLELSA